MSPIIINTQLFNLLINRWTIKVTHNHKENEFQEASIVCPPPPFQEAYLYFNSMVVRHESLLLFIIYPTFKTLGFIF
jgi:hypothetical protein